MEGESENRERGAEQLSRPGHETRDQREVQRGVGVDPPRLDSLQDEADAEQNGGSERSDGPEHGRLHPCEHDSQAAGAEAG